MNFVRLGTGELKYNNIILIIKYITATFIIFSVAFMLLRFPETAGQGVKDGLELCVTTLIPSMFPFIVLSTYSIESGIILTNIKPISKLTSFIFGFPGECAAVIFFSMIGGLPIGAKMTEGLYEKGVITKQQGQRLLLFCVNPGPAFVIGSVGHYMLGSKTVGLILYASVILSSLIIGFLSRFIREESTVVSSYTTKTIQTEKSVLPFSVIKSAKTMSEICVWVVLFSCINSLVAILPVSDYTMLFLRSITEMTNGCMMASKNLSVPIIAGIIGFSGLCAHFQLSQPILKLKLRYKYFLTARILNAGLAVVICKALMTVIPVTSETFSAGVRPEKSGNSVSLLISVMLILMSVLLLMGDDYSLKRRNNGELKNN